MGLPYDVETAHLRPTPVRAQQGGEHAHRRGLARPVGSQHAEQAPLRHFEIDPVERLGLAVTLGRALRLDLICHERASFWSPSPCGTPLTEH
ncbi:hypothetical protein Pth03_28730 [Planotetraspora thailandica]|uniref:Uncharacterized protein n=1 Tax=Planotetraspora thailandica TaxID=487172 RepID=A0A8J3XVM3_9ACTN|nr:hypothetical protein Pth03_28730 [Planotetraspora thailandica]